MSKDPPNSNRPWRDIAEEASEECDSEKVAELSQELIKGSKLWTSSHRTRQSAIKSEAAGSRRRSAMAQLASTTEWKQLYEAALLETDARKLRERITTARCAILDRIEESFTHPLPGEHRAMGEALRGLRILAETALLKASCLRTYRTLRLNRQHRISPQIGEESLRPGTFIS